MAISRIRGAYDISQIAAAGLSVSRAAMNTAAENLANVESVGFKKHLMVQTATAVNSIIDDGFSAALNRSAKVMRPEVKAIVEDQSPGRMEYRPSHPQANAQGYVELPNVNVVEEMTNMMTAQRAYQAMAEVVNNYRTMASDAKKILTS
jgi:flagellar basal-body rod protein FlgC